MSRFEEIFLITFIAAWLVAVALINIARANGLTEDVTIEAGERVPGEGAFLTSPGLNAAFVTDVSAIDTSLPGEIPIDIRIGDGVYKSALTIIDTVPPRAAPYERYIFPGNDIKPEDLIRDVTDATVVTATFLTPPDTYTPGRREITVILTDAGGNVASVVSPYYVYELADFVEIEAGHTAAGLNAGDLILNYTGDGDVRFELPFGDSGPRQTGDYPVIVYADGFSGQTFIRVADTIPPTAEPAVTMIFPGNSVSADELVFNITDATDVVCTFADPPDLYAPGWRQTRVILTDGGGNTSDIDTFLFVFDVADSLVFEAGALSADLSASDFILNFDTAGAFASKDPPSAEFPKGLFVNQTPGTYPVVLKSGPYTGASAIVITDATPPSAKVKEAFAYLDRPIDAIEFLYDIEDASPVAARYKTAPDFFKTGRQDVVVVLEDAYNNKTEFDAVLNVVQDTEPPRISGALNKETAVGGTIAYRAGVTVIDNYDPNPVLTVDSSGVNLKQAGSYAVKYTAVDACGNIAERTGTIIVKDIEVASVLETADEILSQITDGSMTDYEKAQAIYEWVVKRMIYTAGDFPRDLYLGAHACYTRGAGDCYVYMAGVRVLLDRAGIPNVQVQRHGGSTEHYWNLVDAGDGWRHVDACANSTVPDAERFMFSEEQAREYTLRIGGGMKYYEYDKTAVPAVEENALKGRP